MILHEKKYAKNVLLGKIKLSNIYQIVSLLSRYNYHEVKMTDEQSYSFIVQWLQVHNLIYSEYKYSSLIQDCVRKAKKYPFYDIDYIGVTDSELEQIKALNDIRQEKIMFVLLCVAKFQAIAYGFKDNFVTIKIPELFKMARVSVPADEREHILYRLKQSGYIGFPQKVDSQGLFVLIASEGDATLKLNELDCEELAYAYMRAKAPDKINRCKECHRLIKKTSSGVCSQCSGRMHDSIICVDCGTKVEVSSMATKTCRCPECQAEHNKQVTAARVRRYRERL